MDHALAADTQPAIETPLTAWFGVDPYTALRVPGDLPRARGTFVTDGTRNDGAKACTRVGEWINRHNDDPSGRVLNQHMLPASVDVAAR